MRLNAGSGDHTIVVKADLATSDQCEGAPDFPDTATFGGECANGYVGNRTLVVEPTKLANNAQIN